MIIHKKLLSVVFIMLLYFNAGTIAVSSEDSDSVEHPVIKEINTNPPTNITLYPLESYLYMQIIDGRSPVYSARQDFVSSDGRFTVDYSQYSNVTLNLKDWPGDEFMAFLEGQVEISDVNGQSKIYGPGDMIVMPKGFTGTWRQLSDIRKISITYGWEE